MEKRPLKPAEITDYTIRMAEDKAGGSFQKLLILGILAGAFIAFAAEGSNMAAFNLFAEPTTYGLGKALAGAIFGTGLMLVVLAGGELFTGNTMILAAVCDRKVTINRMLRNWVIVYIGNFIGSVLIAYMMVHSGLFASGADMLGAVTVKIAAYKVNLDFSKAFYLGIMCNWLVCLAVWISYGADTMAGKILSIFFPIWLFITSGFEHSVANMYYIPAGIMAKTNMSFAELSHLSQEVLDSLTWSSFLIHNLIPVTLGNIVGGGIFVGIAYWYTYKKIY
ncbi:formate/nitrite transporter family protein [Sinanaerobacter chloroacetimidivorans]|jgi:formate/nitrite transporter|uniref:Formate/nitrite transporter family protein n=1 Tax=Sinanaerobacter chloroacetimidivorans TaxID=2818044 RepID=A0A8J7W0M8_9FIRM|nr:formate/nitrite transporter family protein [Sinanaerobacter chloroacetimidivorans]MBR0598632.1 formate/nitrite transporter family protein [Sinanaerobacter chloroacetimidivorans]